MRARHVFGFLGFVALLYAAVPGCGNEGEGQQCSVDNGNDDCETGLLCTDHNTLHTQVDICCPAANPTNPACIPGALGTSSSSSSSSSAVTTTTTSVTTGAGGAGGQLGGGGQGGGNGGSGASGGQGGNGGQ
jgi:hypothetical protein